MIVIEELENVFTYPALGLELLRHGGKDNFTLVNRAKSNVLSAVQNTSATSGVRKYCR